MDDKIEFEINCALTAKATNSEEGPIRFIENKSVDFDRFERLLEISRRSRHWANFGPVSHLLEQALTTYLKLPDSRSVVFCSSATTALAALIATKDYLAGRTLSWVTSAYGFYSSWLGPLSGVRIVDCNSEGMLSLSELESLPADSFDGIVITNIFGTSPDIEKYVEFCRLNGKQLIVDNAAVLDGFPRDRPGQTFDEIISFHQTKPWGLGEGGCAVLAGQEDMVFRGMINFGVGLNKTAARWATNAKISDFSCALILNRMREIYMWGPLYQEQAERIREIAVEAGLRMLAPMDLNALIPPHLPMLARHPISYSDIECDKFVMNKYYLPHLSARGNSRRIYDHIVNIPCHPGMAQLSNAEIRSCLQKLA